MSFLSILISVSASSIIFSVTGGILSSNLIFFCSLVEFLETTPRIDPTSTFSPSFEFIFEITPLTGEGTSKLTLSVSNSTTGSSADTFSPSFFSHRATVASVTLSPKTGTNIFSLIYSKTFFIISSC